MRLWHKDLIIFHILPNKQLVGQWRECCCIAKNVQDNGTPNHILVNKIMEYPLYDFIHYSGLVYQEMIFRNYKADWNKFRKYFPYYFFNGFWSTKDLYADWHTDRYLKQCYYNLQEKFDRGAIPENEWKSIENYIKERNLIL